MLRPLEHLEQTIRGHDRTHAHDERTGFEPLRLLTAQLLLMTAAEAVIAGARVSRRERPVDYARTPRGAATTAAAWAPSVLAPLAATAHIVHVSRPSRTTDLATRVLDTAVVGISVGAALAGIVTRRGHDALRAAAPLALATAGVIGLVLDRQERAHAREHRRLARRASIVERLVPARRPRLDHVVVHV